MRQSLLWNVPCMSRESRLPPPLERVLYPSINKCLVSGSQTYYPTFFYFIIQKMDFQRVAIVLGLALTTLFSPSLASPSACVVYTVVESAFAINACFQINTVISIESVTPIYVTDAPTCITVIATASTTLFPSNILPTNSIQLLPTYEDTS
jgi:hypothetical protein